LFSQASEDTEVFETPTKVSLEPLKDPSNHVTNTANHVLLVGLFPESQTFDLICLEAVILKYVAEQSSLPIPVLRFLTLDYHLLPTFRSVEREGPRERLQLKLPHYPGRLSFDFYLQLLILIWKRKCL
jgi:hypothetical protein